MYRIAAVCLVLAAGLLALPDGVRYLRWSEGQPLLSALSGSGEKLPTIVDGKEWDAWIRTRDGEVRGRIERGAEDAISSWILHGTSFGAATPIASPREAVNAAGNLTPAARGRVDAFIRALDDQDTERFRMALDFLRRLRVPQDELRAFLTGNLRRFAIRLNNGISTEASLASDFAIDETLRTLKSRAGIPGVIRRIGVVGPGLDFAGEPDRLDIYPPQSVQSFAVMDSAVRWGIAPPGDLQMVAFDLNPWVLSCLRAVKSRAGQRNVLQFVRREPSGWTSAAAAYWQHIGDTIGTSVTPVMPPAGFESRAVAVKTQFTARLRVEEMNVVTQTMEVSSSQGLELVVATGVLGAYNRLEQALALTSVAQMMAAGGILLVDGVLPGAKIPELELLGEQQVRFTDTGQGAGISIYRRKSGDRALNPRF